MFEKLERNVTNLKSVKRRASQIETILRMIQDGHTKRSIAARFGVKEQVIFKIQRENEEFFD